MARTPWHLDKDTVQEAGRWRHLLLKQDRRDLHIGIGLVKHAQMHKLSFMLEMSERFAVGLAYVRDLLKATRPLNAVWLLLIRLST